MNGVSLLLPSLGRWLAGHPVTSLVIPAVTFLPGRWDPEMPSVHGCLSRGPTAGQSLDSVLLWLLPCDTRVLGTGQGPLLD